MTFKSRNRVLSGTLTLPVRKGVHPAAIMVLGSGSLNSDGEVEGLKPFKLLATELAKNGFVVLRYDNRSKGLTGGKPIEQATTRELAQDAQAAFSYLRSRGEVDKQRIGFIGHSEGSTIAAIATTMSPEAKFLIAINGTTSTGFDDILLTIEQRLRKAGMTKVAISDYLRNLKIYLSKPASASVEERKRAVRNMIRYEISQLPAEQRAKVTRNDIEAAVNSQMDEVSSRWEQEYLSLSPAAYYRKIRCSVSLLFSDSELEGLLSRKLILAKKALNKTNRRYTIKIVPNTDHNLIRTNSATHRKAVALDFIQSVVEAVKKSS